MKILVVDDSKIIRITLRKIFIKAGYIVEEAENGKEAIIKYKSFRPDVVTMDITMPDTSGKEALEKIKKIDEKAKIIMISAINQKKMVFDCLKLGASNYIIKPLNSEKVLSVINEVNE